MGHTSSLAYPEIVDDSEHYRAHDEVHDRVSTVPCLVRYPTGQNERVVSAHLGEVVDVSISHFSHDILRSINSANLRSIRAVMLMRSLVFVVWHAMEYLLEINIR